MAEVDESFFSGDFLTISNDLKCNKEEQKALRKIEISYEKKIKKEERERKALARQQDKEIRQKVKEEKLQKKRLDLEERKRKQTAKREAQLEKRLNIEQRKSVLGQREIITNTIKMMNGEFGEQLPVLPTQGIPFVKTCNWLPEHLKSYLGSCM